MARSARELGQHCFGFWMPPLSLNRMRQSSSSFVLNFPLTFSAAVRQLLPPAPKKAAGRAAVVLTLLAGGAAGPGRLTQGGRRSVRDSQCLCGVRVRAGHTLPGGRRQRTGCTQDRESLPQQQQLETPR